MFEEKRVRVLQGGEHKSGPILYVMGRDFRVEDNWAFLYAQQKALEYKVPLGVLVHMGKGLVKTNERQHSFLIDGLEEVAEQTEKLGITFFITYGDWKKEVTQFVQTHEVGMIVTDFSPLHGMRWWWDEVSHGLNIPISEVDAHNIVPCWLASDKEELAAHTFRPKLNEQYKNFSGEIPEVQKHIYKWPKSNVYKWPCVLNGDGQKIIDWNGVKMFRKSEIDISPVPGLKSGPRAAQKVFESFLSNHFKNYDRDFKNPNYRAESKLSPYVRYGYISAQRIAYEVSKIRGNEKNKETFFERFVIRRELAENYCYYNSNYNSFDGFKSWAKQTLDEHREDKREYLYTFEQFESGETHDPIWNAAHLEMKKRGQMHGYIRTYWAKKILEWSSSPEEAIEVAITLNDRYSIDGRDSSVYAGIMWSIGGVHDRAWYEKDTCGKIRSMSQSGCHKKFDVDAYVKYSESL